jgi:hypothetical protein
MVSTWWLLWTLLGGGCLGFVLFALAAVARGSDDRDIRIGNHLAAHPGVQETAPLS